MQTLDTLRELSPMQSLHPVGFCFILSWIEEDFFRYRDQSFQFCNRSDEKQHRCTSDFSFHLSQQSKWNSWQHSQRLSTLWTTQFWCNRSLSLQHLCWLGQRFQLQSTRWHLQRSLFWIWQQSWFEIGFLVVLNDDRMGSECHRKETLLWYFDFHQFRFSQQHKFCIFINLVL